jgi:ADP-heptose:LPS heptosyltransferase
MKKFLKKIELSTKNIIKIALKNKFKPQIIAEPTNCFNASNVKKVLFLRHDRIGDVLVSIPIFRNIKSKYPNIQFHILLSHKNFQLKDSITKYSTKFYCYNKKILSTIKTISKIRKEQYDLIIDLLDNDSATSDLFLKFSKAKNLLGIQKENQSNYTYVVPLLNKHKYHIVERIAQLLLPFDINLSDIDLSLEYDLNDKDILLGEERLGTKTKEIRLGINLSGSSPNKYWGKQNNIDFIKYVEQNYNNIEIIIFSVISFKSQALEIADNTNARLAPNLPTFNEFASMIKTCDIILTPDTSVVHLASAWKKHCIALFSHIPGRIAMPWLPYKTQYIAITTESEDFASIPLSKVTEAFDKIYSIYINHP